MKKDLFGKIDKKGIKMADSVMKKIPMRNQNTEKLSKSILFGKNYLF